MLRNKQALIPYLLLAAALAGGVLWYESEQVPRLGQVVTTGQPDVGGPFRLTDQTGRAVTDADFRGRYQLIYFGYSFCPDVCPHHACGDGPGAGQAGPGRQAHRAAVHHHRPGTRHAKVLAEYMKAFGPQFVGLTGSTDAIKAVEKRIPRLCGEEAH